MTRPSPRSGSRQRLLQFIPVDVRERVRTVAVRTLFTLASVALVCSVFVILRGHVKRFECYQVESRSLAPTELPEWGGRTLARELAVLPDLPERFSIMEDNICERVAAAFKKNPWVEDVLAVKKVYPNRMSVELKLRRPVAGVRVGKYFYLVDAEAHRLSGGYAEWPRDVDAPPVICSLAREVPPRGQAWTNESVRAGAAVAEVLRQNAGGMLTRFVAIDVTNVGGRCDRMKSDIVLITDRNTRVSWGRSPLLVNSPGELTPEEKIAKMEVFEKRRGPLSTYREVDIRFQDVLHEPRAVSMND